MRAGVTAAALLLAALLAAGCGEEAPPAPPAPRDLDTTPTPEFDPVAAPAPAVDGRPGPAGEVPARSRRPFDAGDAPRTDPGEAVAFDLGIPGPDAAVFHYHARVLADGKGRLLPAGAAGAEPWRVVLLRVGHASAAAEAVRKALPATATGVEVIDPAVAGGCGDAETHRAPGDPPAPASRVVRFRVPSEGRAAAVAAAAAAAGAEPSLAEEIGGAEGATARLDILLVE